MLKSTTLCYLVNTTYTIFSLKLLFINYHLTTLHVFEWDASMC